MSALSVNMLLPVKWRVILKIKMGIIAEDYSDIDTLNILVKRISNTNFSIKKYAAKGCAKLRRKCSKISLNWISQKVTHIIICHDSDCENPKKIKDLNRELKNKISNIPNHKKTVCIVIPVQEIESWLLADIPNLKKRFSGINIKDIPNPEKVNSPKEFIEKASRKKCKPRYIHAIHNSELANNIDIDLIRNKCPNFLPFYKFVNGIQ